MPPKVPRTPAKKELQDDGEDLESLIYFRDKEFQGLVRNKQKLERLPEQERTSVKIAVYQRVLDAASAEFKSLQQRIIRTDPKKRDEHWGKSEEFENVLVEAAILLEGWKRNLAPAPGSSNVPEPAIPRPIVIQQSLPRIVPTFDGKYENWEKFKVMFHDVVGKSNELPRIKLYHLEQALIGDAAGLLDSKTIQGGNYDFAWELLQERSEDKRRMVDLHIGSLLKVKKLSRESHSELRALVDSVICNVENLKYLGQEFTGISEQIVVYIVTQALDDCTRKIWESTVKRGELPKYAEMIQTLKDRISVLERCEVSCGTPPKQQQAAGCKSSAINVPYTIANTATALSQPGLRCDICGERHLTYKCAAFTRLTMSQRMELAKERKVCFNCLRGGHRARKCRRKSSCGKCQRRHHTLLHGYPKSADSRNVAAQSAGHTFDV